MKINPRWLSLGLSLAGCLGVPLTSWLSIKGHEEAKTKDTKKGKILCYWKAGVSGLATCGCIMGSHGVSRKEIAKLTGIATLAIANKDKIEQVVKKQFGPEKLNEVKQETGKEFINDRQIHGCISYERSGCGNERFFFYDKNRFFLSNRLKVMEAERQINDDLHIGCIPEWNDFYKYNNITQIPDGEELIIPYDDQGDGWNVDKLFDLEYVDAIDGAGNPVTILYVKSRLRKEL